MSTDSWENEFGWFNHLLSLEFWLHVEEWIRWKENSRTHIQILGLQNVLPSSLAQRFF